MKSIQNKGQCQFKCEEEQTWGQLFSFHVCLEMSIRSDGVFQLQEAPVKGRAQQGRVEVDSHTHQPLAIQIPNKNQLVPLEVVGWVLVAPGQPWSQGE